MIKIYGFPYTRSTRATWALEEAGAEYEFIPVNLTMGHQNQPEFIDERLSYRLMPFTPYLSLPFCVATD
jgi:glutathione S-transferase